MSGTNNTASNQGYYGYQNGQYVSLSVNGQANYAGAADPNASFGYNGNAYTGAVYTGAAYGSADQQGGDNTYSLFSAGQSPTEEGSQTQSGTGGVTDNSGTPEGTLSNTPGQLPGTQLTQAQDQQIQNQNFQNATSPTLSQSEQATAVNQQAQPGEMLTDQSVDPNADQVNTNDANIQASTVQNVAQAQTPDQIQAAQYQAEDINLQAAATATQAITQALPADALVSTQLQELLTPDANGNLPQWISPAVTAANQLLQGRGISNSSMAGQAITAAILTAAMPVAQANASAVLTAYQQNLSNEQQAALQNGQDLVNAMISNQGADNAAANFNATSENQTNQFMGSLAAQVNQFNAAQTNAISQFNASQTQSAATSSAQLLAQLDQFNANMANQREQFNVQNSIIVQQSNAEYLRAINTANTAVANQDNQLNAQNSMNLSDTAMANLQTQFNDEATMLYNSNMTAEEQNYSLTYLAQQYGLTNNLDQNITDMQEQQALNQQIGTLVGGLFSPLANGAGQAIGSIISGSFGDNGTSPAENTNPTDPGNTDTGVGDVTNPLDLSGDQGGDGGGDGGDGGD